MDRKGHQIILSSKQALLFYGIESQKPFQIDGKMANVGDMLKNAREHRNVTIELLAAKLNLEPNIIRKLEGNRFQALSGDIFVKGYIALLARELNADLEPLMLVYQLRKEPSEVETNKNEEKQSLSVRSKIGYVFLVIVFALSVYYLSYLIQSSSTFISSNSKIISDQKE